ncbi:hypothetical protein YYC_03733 [Plasmodium yoelii 17X]|uniref:Transporter n=3 Tax=Plasmodium yoelii TaxID=5861 RepID=A0AAE9WN44_PLAYO|nr:conserved Plasmodium membrane protein, unknown function [Plasmodium yoelii]ETB59003.1 hypothetical protein YYC_03733 [Plasmodium yoelii 17X]WBY55580.1 hypothetical protein Py17XNL_000504433 [Plasmodium yoelii yoelii]CDU16663.1 conserved Plasmodium membrane protein, unknown function [Plasmodium yoelii]VTZ74152.1 conserved Plasmodium membrane protein, unknown function [Plasmodium yoelii]|eukprot:XP_022811649.1 conserved Plasmodium membrane protein, unknown function [Plasmodium yoelii]
MRKSLRSSKNIFKRGVDNSKALKWVRNISPLFFMSEFIYILFLRYNDYVLSTRYKSEVNADTRNNIYNILILLYFLKPLFAFLTDNVYFNINNIFLFLLQKAHELCNWIKDGLYYCARLLYNGKHMVLKIFFRKYLKDGLTSGQTYFKKCTIHSNNPYVNNFLYFPLNRKYYVIITELITTILLLFIYIFNNKIKYNWYLFTIFIISSQMLLSSCVFEGVVVEKCRRKMHFEQIFYISYVMCIKIFSSLMLYYIYILKVSIFILILKSFIIFLISCLSNEETLLLNDDCNVQNNMILKEGNKNIGVKNTVDLLSQLVVLKKILLNENLLKILFLLILFNSSIDTKFTILNHGIKNYSWPNSLINYIPLVSQSSKLIGISIFQLYTNKKRYENYAMITILINILLKIASFIYFYYNKNTYVSPILILLNIIVQNISIKILALPILLLCIQKAPLNLESTLINIYIFSFNLSNLISKRYFMWDIILQMPKNVFIVLLLSFFTTCTSLFYYFNISLDILNNMYISSSLNLEDKDNIYLKYNKPQKKNYFNINLFNKGEKNHILKKTVRFKDENIKTHKTKDEEMKNKNSSFQISSNSNSDSEQWLIIDNLKGEMRRKYTDNNPSFF